MHAAVTFDDKEADTNASYEFSLAAAANDILIFTNEGTQFHRRNLPEPRVESLGAGHRESLLEESGNAGNPTSRIVRNALRRCRPYHFHDTSATAKIRQSGYIEDNAYLRSDAGNLAAMLYGLKNRPETTPYFERIENTIRQAFPQFKQFVLEPQRNNGNYVMLNWYSRHNPDYLFGPHQFSDGALRFAALTTLLSLPPSSMSGLIVLDEPELGLHPQAIGLLAEMLKSAACAAQVLVATQSPVLVNQFDLSQIRPIEHRHGRSAILELDTEAYTEWLEEYSTGELWEKNIIGGGPIYG
jgi:predicted ATPase